VSGDTVCHDRGGWISGPSASVEPVAARDVQAGDRLLLEDGQAAEVTDIRHGFYWLESGHEPGIAIGWKAGSSSGVLFRKASDILQRVTSQSYSGS
jgi:hypothetical protein